MNDNFSPAPDTWNEDLQAVSAWIIERALTGLDLGDILGQLCRRINDAGIPVARAHVAMTTLHPMYEARVLRWVQTEEEGEEESIPHRAVPSDDWMQSPLRPLAEGRATEMRHRLNETDAWREYPLLGELRDQGFTDYFTALSGFRPHEEAVGKKDGFIMSWATRQPGGFSDFEIEALRRLQRRFAVAVKMASREDMALNILSAYLGGDAARRVLDGQIRLGDGDVIPSVIWYSDLRRSTPLAEQLPGPEFLALLNDYFACTAGAVLDGGGDVLRFIGDAVLAIFPIGEGRFTPDEACRRAVDAAADAGRRVAERNRERRENGAPEFAYGLALHVGEVLFGNIGVADRVEFSVIGPAANEVCRLEGLTKDLDETVVVSEAFTETLSGAWRDLGEHALKGVGEKRRIFAPQVP